MIFYQYQYILFDLDGTLTDPKEGITKCVRHALKSFGIVEEDLDKLEPFIGPPLKDSFREFYRLTDEEADRAVEIYRERFSTVGLYENKVYNGIPELLAKLRAEGRHLAVASSKPTVFVEKILNYFSIREYFEVVVGSELDGRRVRKEEVVQEALDRLYHGGAPDREHTIMVGDRCFDIEGAEALGLCSVGVQYGYARGNELQDAGATYIAANVKQLGKILLDTKEKTHKAQIPKEQAAERKPKAGEGKNPASEGLAPQLAGQKEGAQRNTFSPVMKIMRLVLPVCIYYVIAAVFIMVGKSLIDLAKYGINAETFIWFREHQNMVDVTLNGLGMVVGFLCIRRVFLQEVFWGGQDIHIRTGRVYRLWIGREGKACIERIRMMVPVVLIAITSSIFLNLLMGRMGIVQMSETYTETATAQYSVPVWLGLILYGIVSPVAEEAIFRGILYNRMKSYYSRVIGIILTSLLFGLYHMNLVQAIYGIPMGFLIVVCYEWAGCFSAAIWCHAAANVAVYLLSNSRVMQTMLDSPMSIVIFGALVVLVVVYMYLYSKNRGTESGS